jgi:hypothetical protein
MPRESTRVDKIRGVRPACHQMGIHSELFSTAINKIMAISNFVMVSPFNIKCQILRFQYSWRDDSASPPSALGRFNALLVAFIIIPLLVILPSAALGCPPTGSVRYYNSSWWQRACQSGVFHGVLLAWWRVWTLYLTVVSATTKTKVI